MKNKSLVSFVRKATAGNKGAVTRIKDSIESIDWPNFLLSLFRNRNKIPIMEKTIDMIREITSFTLK